MEVTGHRRRAVFDRYNIVDSRQIAEAVRRMVARRQRLRATVPAVTARPRRSVAASVTAREGRGRHRTRVGT
jgi:hypothetical protein